MVKKPLAKRKADDGRPQFDPEDLRTARFAMRMNPDLLLEVTVLARRLGFNRSNLVERILIREVNAQAGYELLDAIGRRNPGTGDVVDERGRRTGVPGPSPGDGERGSNYLKALSQGRPVKR